MDPSINAAAEANEMVVKEGVSFREAYKKIGEKYRKK
jgi:argininosuccinate lyase